MVVIGALVLMYAAAWVIARGMRSRAWTSAFASALLDSLNGTLVLSSASASSSSIGSTWTMLPYVPMRLIAAILFLEVMRIIPFGVCGRKLSSGFVWLVMSLICAV